MTSEAKIEKLVRLFTERYGSVLAVARRYAPAPDLAYDVVQQSFIDFVRGAEPLNWDVEAEVTPLLQKIAKNRAMLLWRERRKGNSDALNVFWQRMIDLQAGDDDDKDRRNQEIQAMYGCIEQLPTMRRDWIRLHYMEKVSMEEIAKSEQIKPSTLRQIFSRLRVKLRECIERTLANRDKIHD